MNEIIIESHYKMKGKKIVDTLYDAKVFNEKLTRDDMNNLEDVLALIFQQDSNSLRKVLEFTIRHEMRLAQEQQKRNSE